MTLNCQSLSGFVKPMIHFSAICITTLVMCQCGHQSGGVVVVKDTQGYQANHGPFDSNGNYVEAWADNPPKRRYVSHKRATQHMPPARPQYVQQQPSQQPAPQQYVQQQPARQQYVQQTPPARVPTQVSTPKPRPKPVLVKAKPRIPQPVVHTVRPKETLYSLSRRYSTSVDAIKRSNRISGNTIRIGQRLNIPRN